MSNFFQGIKSLFSATSKWWQSLSFFSHNLVINLFLGLSVVFVLWLFSDSPWLMEAEDASMDWLMPINKNNILSEENNIPPFVFLDIDEKTHQAWNKPLVIPKNRVIHLIDAAIRAKARLILVTFNINRALSSDKYHNELKEYLADYATKCREQQEKSGCPPIILLREFQPHSDLVQTPRTGFLDDVVAQAAPYIQWASGQFYQYSDQVVRRGKLWVSSCTTDERAEIIPSMELLATAIIRGCSEELKTALHSLLPKNCGNTTDSKKINPKTIEFCQLEINTNTSGIHPRIMYLMPWLINNKPLRLPYSLTNEFDTPILRVFAAQPYAKLPRHVNLEALSESIVIIGSSYHDWRSIHLTPLGDMPDALITINALYSLLQNDKLVPQPTTKVLITTIIFIVILSISFINFPSLVGLLVWGSVVILGLLPISMIFFNYGTWLNFALPLIVITICQVIVKFWQLYGENNQPFRNHVGDLKFQIES